MARPTSLDLNALGAPTLGAAPLKSSNVSGPVADGLRLTMDNPGQDASFTVNEGQVAPLISKIRNTAKKLDTGYPVKITTMVVGKDGEEDAIRQADIKAEGKRLVRVYFRVKNAI